MKSPRTFASFLVTLVAMVSLAPAAAMAQDTKPKASSDDVRWIDFASADFCSVLVYHRARIGEFKEINPADVILGAVPGLDEVAVTAEVLKPKNIDRVAIFADPFPGGNVAFLPGAVMQFKEDVDGDKLLRDAWEDVEPATHAKKTYLRYKRTKLAGAPVAGYVADKRILLVAPEPTLRRMLDGGKPGPLAKQLQGVDWNHDVVVQHSGKALTELMSRRFGVLPEKVHEGMADKGHFVTVLVRDIQSVSARLDLKAAKIMSAEIVASNAAAAKEIKASVEAAQSTLKDPQIEKSEGRLGLGKPIGTAVNQMAVATEIRQADSKISIEIATPAAWNDALAAVVDQIKQSAAAKEKK